MTLNSVRFSFRQPFRVSARAAYEWCTDFRDSDGRLFEQKWERQVRRLSGDALVLVDTTWPNGRRRVIHRLVRLNPEELSWTNTHLTGPFQHSQYWYRISSDGTARSHLDFSGLRLVRSSKPLGASKVAEIAAEERRGDSTLWRDRLAPALERDLGR